MPFRDVATGRLHHDNCCTATSSQERDESEDLDPTTLLPRTPPAFVHGLMHDPPTSAGGLRASPPVARPDPPL